MHHSVLVPEIVLVSQFFKNIFDIKSEKRRNNTRIIHAHKIAGSRFALMELKAILYYLLLNFSFEPNKDTQIPLKFKPEPFANPEKGVQLELRPRAH